MGRQLGAFETALTLSDAHAPLNVVAVLRLAAGPSAEALRRALDALQRRHPLLQVRIARRGRRYVYEEAGVGEVPLRLAGRGGDDAWVREAEAELGLRLDAATGPLVRCVLMAGDGDQREILLTFHHAIMDAASAVHLCGELLAACADPEAFEGSAPRALLEKSGDYFPPAYRGWRRWLRLGGFLLRLLRAELEDRRRAAGRWHPPAAGPDRCRILSFQLSEVETSHLVRRTRKRRVTLHSVFDAALLLALARHLYPGETLPLRHLVFANLRPYLKPPVSETDLGSYFAMLRFTTGVGPGSELFEVAAEINARVHAAGKRGDKYAFSLTSAAAMRDLIRRGTQRMAATALSYTGAVRLEAGGPFPVRGLHAFVSNFRLGPEYAVQVRLFAGRLWWDVLYLEADLEEAAARRIADDVRSLLVSPGATGG